jgi:hypothetical protein
LFFASWTWNIVKILRKLRWSHCVKQLFCLKVTYLTESPRESFFDIQSCQVQMIKNLDVVGALSS